MSVEYGCYLKQTKSGPACRFCGNGIAYGEAFARIYINSYANPYFHPACLTEMAGKAKAEEANLDRYKAEKAAKDAEIKKQQEANKVESKKKKKRASFQKQIIRDSLKTQDVLVSKIKITGGGVYSESDYDIGSYNYSRPKKSQFDPGIEYVPGVRLIFFEDSVYINAQGYYGNYTNTPPKSGEKYCLADPESLTKIGESIMKWAKVHSTGHPESPLFKYKKKKKAKNGPRS